MHGYVTSLHGLHSRARALCNMDYLIFLSFISEQKKIACKFIVCFSRYIATGDSMQDIALNFKIGVSTVPYIVHATVRVLFEELQPRCMKASRPFYFLCCAFGSMVQLRQ